MLLSTKVKRGIARRTDRLAAGAIACGLPPSFVGYRAVPEIRLESLIARGTAAQSNDISVEEIHPFSVSDYSLPANVTDRDRLSADRSWFGYSQWEVPERPNKPTWIVTLRNCRLLFCREPEKNNFQVAILDAAGRSIRLREIAYRAGHGTVLRRGRPPVQRKRVTWITERVYHNHSHWLTAHLPKLCFLRDRNQLEDVLLPPKRSDGLDASIRAMGLDPESFDTFDPTRPLEVEELTLLCTDRFRPELLAPVRDAVAHKPDSAPWRRILISRQKAKGRQLVNEDALFNALTPHGFERVVMEDMTFEAQIRLMGETAVIVAPHGAGLTNMMFCHPRAEVVEICDPDYPNPNFYALSCAMDHRYWLIHADTRGEGHPLTKDLVVDIDEVLEVVAAVTAPPQRGEALPA